MNQTQVRTLDWTYNVTVKLSHSDIELSMKILTAPLVSVSIDINAAQNYNFIIN